MDILLDLATEGLGFTLFVLAVFVIIYLNRKIEAKEKELTLLHERLLTESNLYTKSFTEIAKEMVAANRDAVNSTAVLQKSVDTIAEVIQSIVQNKR